jgi:hypothetical protein
MSWSDQVFRYCERGVDPGFWAEPVNAVSNAAFILAAIAAAIALSRERRKGEAGAAEMFLILLVLVIGVGSFLFHTFATRWSGLADIAPIGLFMLAYLAYALRVYLGLGWISVALGAALFIAALQGADSIECQAGVPSVITARGHCLNGTIGYMPAFVAMVAIGTILALKRHPAARYLLLAGGTFMISMAFRTVDSAACPMTTIGGHALGTHFLWHILNATTLYILLLGAIRTGRKREVAFGASLGP